MLSFTAAMPTLFRTAVILCSMVLDHAELSFFTWHRRPLRELGRESMKGEQRLLPLDFYSGLLAPTLPSTLFVFLAALLHVGTLATAMTLCHIVLQKKTALKTVLGFRAAGNSQSKGCRR